MALADTGKAIGKVTKLLIECLGARTRLTVTEGRTEPSANSSSTKNNKLNIFLYEALFDPSLKNISLDEGQPPPLWLVLKYLMTAFDKDGYTDTVQAHEYLGQGICALQELSFLLVHNKLPIDVVEALSPNPEPLKITFDEVSSELLSKLMQGSDEKYRFSIGFQVRPVMIVTREPPSYSLLVGVDYTKPKPGVIGEEGIHLDLLPSLGPKITRVEPSKFEVHNSQSPSAITIFGSDLNLSNLSVSLGAATLTIAHQRPDRLECTVDGNISISAGSHPLSIVQTLPSGRKRRSNLLIGELLPTLSTATPSSLKLTKQQKPNSPVFILGEIEMTGFLLGSKTDDIFVALFRNGRVEKVFDTFTTNESQQKLTLKIAKSDAVPPGKYLVILRVNGQQAKQSPKVDLTVP
jgi:hypothetical protein